MFISPVSQEISLDREDLFKLFCLSVKKLTNYILSRLWITLRDDQNKMEHPIDMRKGIFSGLRNLHIKDG